MKRSKINSLKLKSLIASCPAFLVQRITSLLIILILFELLIGLGIFWRVTRKVQQDILVPEKSPILLKEKELKKVLNYFQDSSQRFQTRRVHTYPDLFQTKVEISE